MTNIQMLAHISREQDFLCFYCQVRMRWPRKTHSIQPTTVTKEHLTPRFRQGKDERENYAAACCRCNHLRGHLDIDVFKAIQEKLFEVAFIRINWHSTDPDTVRFIRKIFQYEVDAFNAFNDQEAALRSIRRSHYSLDLLVASGVPLEQQVPIIYSSRPH